MLKHCNLIDNSHFPQKIRDASTMAKYEYVNSVYRIGNTHIIQNNTRVFGPYPEPTKPWDISEAEKVVVYNREVAKVLAWVMTRIVINLSKIDYRTLHVLIRIATGMLNNCNIPKELSIMFHDNMVENLTSEYNTCVSSELPF